VVVGFAYHIINAVGLALGKGGLFPPIMAAWLAPVLFMAFAFYLINENF
jgi:lipopolysaccharide export LptBFGC system permease protein LptF